MIIDNPVTRSSKPRWSDFEDEANEQDLSFLLPPRQVIGPDNNGIKKVIEYKFNEKGEMVRVTTTTKIRKFVLPSKRAVERRSWPKFGDAVNEDVSSKLSMVSTEQIFLERPKAKGSEAEESKTGRDSLAQLSNRGATLMLCRTCGKKGDHWTAKCPYKDLAPQNMESSTNGPPSADGSASSSTTNKNTYIPPSKRAGAQRSSASDMRRWNDVNSLRVDCLSLDACESDLYDLFSPFGKLTRVFVPTDRQTGLSRGFGFVNFVNKEDAQRAIDKLHGYGYDHLILKVKWATPRSN